MSFVLQVAYSRDARQDAMLLYSLCAAKGQVTSQPQVTIKPAPTVTVTQAAASSSTPVSQVALPETASVPIAHSCVYCRKVMETIQENNVHYPFSTPSLSSFLNKLEAKLLGA